MPRVKRKSPARATRRRWNLAALRRTAIGAGASVAIAGVAYGAYYVWHESVLRRSVAAVAALEDTLMDQTASLGLRVQEISVTGRAETPAASVLAAINARRDAPILLFSPAAAKTALENLPWVRRASVERRLPNTIHADIVERKPLALWQRDQRLVVIDHDGQEIRGVDAERFAELLVLVGDDAPQNANSLIALMASEPAFRPHVDAAIRVGGRRWNVRLDNGVEIQLPETNPSAAWARLAALNAQSNLLDGSARVLDLRLPDRLIVRVARDAAPTAPPEPLRTGRSRPPRQI
jgi:cell division protein FtsQ